MRLAIGATVLAVGLLATGNSGQEREAPHAKAQVMDIPENGKCCLWRLGLTARGEISHNLGDVYKCPSPEGPPIPTRWGGGSMRLELASAGRKCDESQTIIPPGSTLNARLHTYRRADEFAVLFGEFWIKDPGMKDLFTGRVELVNKINSFPIPRGNEPCDRRDQMEGWLAGTGVKDTKADGYLLRAVFAARTDPGGDGEKMIRYAIGAANLDGALIVCKE